MNISPTAQSIIESLQSMPTGLDHRKIDPSRELDSILPDPQEAPTEDDGGEFVPLQSRKRRRLAEAQQKRARKKGQRAYTKSELAKERGIPPMTREKKSKNDAAPKTASIHWGGDGV